MADTKSGDLDRSQWLQGALAVLAEGGVDAVKVEPLAARLGVTKGSFYWHFKDRPALLSALFDLWENDFTRRLIEDAAPLPTPQARLRAIANAALVKTMAGVDNARAEIAMQAWAAKDEAVAQRLRKVDAQRIAYLSEEFRALGLDEQRASIFAKTLYHALTGLYAARAYNRELADDAAFRMLLELMLAQARWSR